ncbi:hypothetical protein IWQ60_002356 [Tieghemiomyces parasiticus]|uniref:Cytochrome b5 heme-binding domain-containing protein n=1 Tax=Tieghemiomyces parasiticus TaxID=78921 RepID=A0A9W8DXG5_9FUNG|nr:hypothetical protein IWQ60_002356 [Tieghemiomyces parasiticus]
MYLYLPTQRKEIVLNGTELARYDGSDPSLPIYIAINGRVYDVSESDHYYGPGGSYHFFAGKDAARAWGTNCLGFPAHYTHDLRGLTETQLQGVEGWQSFYDDHHTYYYVGRVLHEPIDPESDIPPDCKGAIPKPAE